MRSEYVFAAAKEIGNRFMLCRVAAVSARRLHAGSRQPSETINQSLQLIASADITEHNCRELPLQTQSQPAPVLEVEKG